MLIDVLIIALAIGSLVRGKQIGFLRQASSTVGFFSGLFLGAWLQPYTVRLVHSQASSALVTILTTLGMAFLLLTVGEYVGLRLKHLVLFRRLNSLDNGLGAVLGIITFGLSVWLLAAVAQTLPYNQLHSAIDNSKIITALNKNLPSAPQVIVGLGRLIDPNGFPAVFIGREPRPHEGVIPPSIGELKAAVVQDQPSIVKIVGQGCGGIVDGSGFVVKPGLVATNAHVVAGIDSPRVQDTNGTHHATVIWFDPNLDFAILRVSNLAGSPLNLSNRDVASIGTPTAILGYPGGGEFAAKAGAILDHFTASGRNIYGKANTNRAVYEVQADIIPGNSGGPMVGQDGSVLGVVFAESTSYDHVGYALTAQSISSSITQAQSRNQIVSTGQCAE